jgi:peroxiredoxin
MRPDIVPGARFPDYELLDHTGTQQRLSELQGEQPMIVVLIRGNVCEKDVEQHGQLADFWRELAVGYTRLVTIAAEAVAAQRVFRSTVRAEWPFLADPERVVLRDLDIEEYTGSEPELMIPHTIVLEPGLVVHKIYNGYWFWGRPSLQDLRSDLRAIFGRRADWELSPLAGGSSA